METVTGSSWTEISQAIAAIVAIPGGAIAVYFFFKKDKARDAEVKSLVQIASQLVRMQEDAEVRYRNTKRPYMTVRASLDNTTANRVWLNLINTNIISMIMNYEASVSEDVKLTKYTINTIGGQQSWDIILDYPNGWANSHVIVGIDYLTEEGYEFIQDIHISVSAAGAVGYSTEGALSKENGVVS